MDASKLLKGALFLVGVWLFPKVSLGICYGLMLIADGISVVLGMGSVL